MRVLIVTPFPVLPLSHGGRVRTDQLATRLARCGAQVDVLCPWAPGAPFRRFVREGVAFHPHAFCANALPPLLPDRLVPSLVALSCQPYRGGARRRLSAFADYDIVQFENCANASWMERLPRGPRIVYAPHNVEQDFVRARIGRSPVLRRVVSLEQRALLSSDLVIACTDADAARLRDLHDAIPETAVVPNGFAEELLDLDRRGRPAARATLGIREGERCVLFVGGPADHNRRAVRFLERELLPQLGEDARLLLVGRCAAGRARRRHGVLRLGYVADLRQPLLAADVGVNPVTYGSGSSLKVAEYLGAGIPVVSTPVGIRGFESLGEYVTVTEPTSFAEALRAPAAARAPRSELERFTWGAIVKRLYELYEGLVRG